MVFSSLLFLFRFLPAVLLVYYIVPRRLRNFVLLLFSLGFYAWGEPIYIILMLASILISYTSGILIDKFKQAEKMQEARITLIVACVASLSLLAFFKYAGFVVETVNSLTGVSISMLHIALPIGISFYTFQTLSYTIEKSNLLWHLCDNVSSADCGADCSVQNYRCAASYTKRNDRTVCRGYPSFYDWTR